MAIKYSKKWKFLFTVALGLALVGQVQAEEPPPTFEFHGDAAMLTVYSQKPSAVQNRSSFVMPEGRFAGAYNPFEDFSLESELLYGKSRDSVDGKYNLQLEALYFQFRQLFLADLGLPFLSYFNYGMVTNSWEDLSESLWGYRYLGTQGPTLGLRFAYLRHSDLGIATGGQLKDWLSWSFSIVNGEGNSVDEQGPRKDFQFVLESHPEVGGSEGKYLTLALLILEGGYDNIDAEISQKERLGVLVGYQQPQGLMGSLEVMTTRDPVDGMNSLLADRVDLTAQGGQVAKGQGGSLILKYRVLSNDKDSPKFYEFFSRTDRWNPAVGVDAKGIRSQMLGIGFFPRQNLQFSLAWSDVQYEINHAASVRDTSDIDLAARLKW